MDEVMKNKLIEITNEIAALTNDVTLPKMVRVRLLWIEDVIRSTPEYAGFNEVKNFGGR